VRRQGIDVAVELPDLLPDPVIGCDNEGTVVYWSRAAEETYGYGTAEAVGQRAATLLRTRFPVPLLEITEELTDLGRWQGRLEHRCKDGRTVSVHSRWVARRDDRGARVGHLAVDRELDGDPVPAPQAPPGPGPDPETAPRRADLSETTPRALAHELNNALAVIINYTAFVIGELESLPSALTDEARQSMRADLDQVQAAAERALEITRGTHG
jgi:two-component system, LuxR family, sensor kinase FixL